MKWTNEDEDEDEDSVLNMWASRANNARLPSSMTYEKHSGRNPPDYGKDKQSQTMTQSNENGEH